MQGSKSIHAIIKGHCKTSLSATYVPYKQKSVQ